jgi:hypothetical protein
MSGKRFHTITALSALALCLATMARGGDGTWVKNGGNWGEPTNWLGGTVADGADAKARFVTNITVGSQQARRGVSSWKRPSSAGRCYCEARPRQ